MTIFSATQGSNVEQYCSHSKQCNNNVVTPCYLKIVVASPASRVTSPLVENQEVGVPEVRQAGEIGGNYAIVLLIFRRINWAKGREPRKKGREP